MSNNVSIFKVFSVTIFSFVVFALIHPLQYNAAYSKQESWYSSEFTYLVDKGVLDEEFVTQLQANKKITRGELSSLLVSALNLSTESESSIKFSDISKEDGYYGAIASLANRGIINGYHDGTFQPNHTVTRAEVAKMMTNAFELEPSKNTELPFLDVNENHWAAAYIASLYENELIKGVTEDQFGPSQNLTVAQAVVIVSRAMQKGEPSTIPTNEEEFTINEVVSLNENGRFLEMTFNQPVSFIETTQFTIYDTSSHARKGVETVEVIGDGNKAVVTMFKNAEIEKLRDYTIELKVENQTAEYHLHRENFYSKVKITDIDVKEREITFTDDNQTITLTVLPTVDFDFVEAYNQKVNLSVNGEKEVTKIAIDEFEKLKDKFKYIRQFDLNEYLFIEKVEENKIVGINQELPLNSFDVIVKNHKLAAPTELKKGELLVFNYDDKVAEICTNIVEGKIEKVFDSGIEVNGEVYDYNNSEFVKGGSIEEFTSKEASKLEGKKVILFLDKDDELIFAKR